MQTSFVKRASAHQILFISLLHHLLYLAWLDVPVAGRTWNPSNRSPNVAFSPILDNEIVNKAAIIGQSKSCSSAHCLSAIEGSISGSLSDLRNHLHGTGGEVISSLSRKYRLTTILGMSWRFSCIFCPWCCCFGEETSGKKEVIRTK